jgi:hypothetical protein
MFNLWKSCGVAVFCSGKNFGKVPFLSTGCYILFLRNVNKVSFRTAFIQSYPQVSKWIFTLLIRYFWEFFTPPTITTNYLIRKGNI